MGGIGITGEESGLLGGGSLLEGAPFHKFLSLFLSSLLSSPLVPFPPLSLVLLLYHGRCFATGSFSRSPRALAAACRADESRCQPWFAAPSSTRGEARVGRVPAAAWRHQDHTSPRPRGILASVPHAAATTPTTPGSRCPCVRAAAPHKKTRIKLDEFHGDWP